jgi:RNA polymerase sigma-70 factor (ECF subfamily)
MTTDSDQERFVALFTQIQPDLRRYIHSLVGNLNDTDEVVQNTSLALWRKFERYESDQPFLNWAFRFAYYEVMKFRERRKRGLGFCTETLKLIADEYDQDVGLLRVQRRVLETCRMKLPEDEQALLEMRYEQKMTVAQINVVLNETGKRLYRVLERIRRKLAGCVDKHLAEEGWS